MLCALARFHVVQGMLACSRNLCRIGMHPQHVLARADYAAINSKQVVLISGGGSGHEPAHAGFVGEGMLTGAVLGGVFASPSSSAVLSAIMALAGEPGCLLIVKNYTGDRLNFGIAMEKARTAGIQCEMCIVGDDCALPKDKGITGRRGIAGTLFVHKYVKMHQIKSTRPHAHAQHASLSLHNTVSPEHVGAPLRAFHAGAQAPRPLPARICRR